MTRFRTKSYNMSDFRRGTQVNARGEQSRQCIKDALLGQLGERRLDAISMSSIAAAAHVSRSTLYVHYPNVFAIFEDAVADFGRNLRELDSQLDCACGPSAVEDGKRPFCVALRDAGKYEHLVRDPLFLPTLLETRALLDERGELPRDLEERDGLNHDLRIFQMSGCYAVAMRTPRDAEWAPKQRQIDAFVRSGREGAQREF